MSSISTEKIMSAPQVWGGLVFGFLAILGVRFTYPIANEILGLWEETNIMKVVAILVMWLIYFFVLWVTVWIKFLQPRISDEKGGV